MKTKDRSREGSYGLKALETDQDKMPQLLPAATANPPIPTARLASLDALRGFDMFWITGGTAILMGLGKVVDRPWFDKFLEQFDHEIGRAHV